MLDWVDRLLMRFIPHFVITNAVGDPYMVRYRLFKSKWFGIYLHHILRSDEDHECHDHPWDFTSLILVGGYLEIQRYEVDYTKYGKRNMRFCRPGRIVRHKAEDAHRLVLDRPAWTLVKVSGKKRQWGFYTDEGWMPFRAFLDRKYGKGNWISE